MNNIIEVNNHKLEIKEYNGQRVVTFKDIDMVHERPEGTARKRFNDNRKRFVEGEDFFEIKEPSEMRTLGLERPQGGVPEKVILVTEEGYLMLVKSFTDDLAWDVQRMLVKSYFKSKDAFENLSPELRAVIVVDQRVTAVEQRVDRLEYDVPLYAAEADELCQAVKKESHGVARGG